MILSFARLFAIGFLAISSAVAEISTSTMIVDYQLTSYASKQRQKYEIELLREALEATKDLFGSYQLKIREDQTSVLRSIALLREGAGPSVMASPAGGLLYESLPAVKIPIYQGLLGYRVLVVRQDSPATKNKAAAQYGINHLVLGQVRGWADTVVYRNHQLKVEHGGNLDTLFSMLQAGRFDAIPLGIIEANPELNIRRASHPQLDIDQSRLLYYPWPMYFYINPKAPELYHRVNTGLELLVKNGGMSVLLNKHFEEALNKINMQASSVIGLENPLLPPDTPLARNELWYQTPVSSPDRFMVTTRPAHNLPVLTPRQRGEYLDLIF
jgi:hypothetical protein